MNEIRPQPKQAEFLSSAADIGIFGGAAGGGKSWALVAEPLRHKDNPKFTAEIFRRERTQITNKGGLWSESENLYRQFKAVPNLSDLNWKFKGGAEIGFSGLQYESDVNKWLGSQIAYLGFDELNLFTEYQFFYMLSRNRSTSGVRPYVRATTNPDPESWVAGFLKFWINQETGFPIEERCGKLRYFVRDGDKLFWSSTKRELAAKFPGYVRELGFDNFAKSVTFFPATVFDNQILLENDPGYLANLMALPLVERERFLHGNWKIKLGKGKFINRLWFGDPVSHVPAGGIDCRFFDFAATAKEIKSKKSRDPDYTATTKIRYYAPKTKNDFPLWIIIDFFQIQADPPTVQRLFDQIVKMDLSESRRHRTRYKLRWEIEPGSASRRENYRMVSNLAGIDAGGVPSVLDKFVRARPFAVQIEHGNVKILNAEWTNELLSHLHNQPDAPHDDGLDSSAGAFNESIVQSDLSGEGEK